MNVVVALKLLDRGEDTLAVTEASALKNLESDHILPVLNAGVHNDVPFVVTEIAAGGTAEGRLKRSPHGLDAGLVIRWARQILTAVDYCHRMRVLHRDITPSNVFLDTDDHARLGDFGAAASLDPSGSADRHGNPLILAPEGLETGRLTTRSEIYSVGATVWRLLTGAWPYEAATEVNLLEKIKGERRPSLAKVAPHLSRSVALVVGKALKPRPDDRYKDAGAFRTALGNCTLHGRLWTPLPPHDGHRRCWIGSFPAGEVAVCVEELENGRLSVDMRRVSTGRRIKRGCAVVRKPGLHAALRRAFEL